MSQLKNFRLFFAFLYDLTISMITYWMALYLRFDGSFDVPESYKLAFIISTFSLVLSYFANGLYKGVWRFSSTHDLAKVIKACLIGIGASVVISFFVFRNTEVPRSLYIIHFLLLVVGLGGGRFTYRFLKDRMLMRNVLKYGNVDVKRVLIIGAGRAGEKLLRDIHATPDLKLVVAGFVDDDKSKRNSSIHNVKIHYGCESIPRLVKELNIQKIFVATPSADSAEIKRIYSFCEHTGCEIKVLPKMDQLLSSQVEISLLRNLKIEDLLGREQVKLDTDHLMAMIENRVILVTGAGGSIGSELCMQIAKFNPKLIVMADYCELFMYELELKFKEAYPNVTYFPKILDVRNAAKVEETFREFKPEIVFHAAAYKHVPMMEYNPLEAIETNVHGTKVVANMALKYEARKFIMISTDKAVNPTNVMGASKRIAEMVITDISNFAKANGNPTKFMSVRFGNVLGSNGSVIPLFRRQIEERKDITVTHPDIIRYFMSIPEACQLVLQAGSMGAGGEIFVLDMGEPVKIVDLAREMIRLAGFVEGRDINIVFSGLRPGEKLYEELFSDKEAYELTMHGKIRKAKFRDLETSFDNNLEKLLSLKSVEPASVVYMIKELVPEFTHFRLVKQSDDDKDKHA